MGFKDFGIMAATFVNLETSASVRIVAREEARTLAKKYAGHLLDRREQQLEAYKTMADEELFAIHSIQIDLGKNDLPGKPTSRVACDQCGEWVQDGREVKRDDTTVCRSCDGQRYYRIA